MGDLNKIRYSHRDYESIKEDLINAIPSLTQEWTGREESDPGIVLIKLISMLGDNLSYNTDKNVLELFLDTVTQRKNCSKILSLLGYKMHWYRSATIGMQVRLSEEYDSQGNPNHIVLSPFKTTFRSSSEDLIYTLISDDPGAGDIDILSATYNTLLKLVEGRVVQVTFNKNSLVNNRYYFAESNVDESHIWLTFGSSHVFKFVNNLYLVTDDAQASFEFNVDEFDRPYIELIKYWEDIVGNAASTAKFTLYYILSSGAAGNVARNQLTKAQSVSGSYVTGLTTNYETGHLVSTTTNSLLVMSHPGSYESLDDAQESNQYTSQGYNPQTVEEAKKDSANYLFTYDTLVNASDFEKASRRVTGITGSKILDNVIIEYEGMDPQEVSSRCSDDFGTEEDENGSQILKAYQAILYLLYLGADSEVIDGEVFNSSNQYNQIEGDYYFSSYSQYDDAPPSEGSEFYGLGYFPYKPMTFITTQVRDLIDESQVLNIQIDFGTSKIFPFKVKGVVHLNEPVSPQDTLLALTNINDALNNFYYPGDRHRYGDLPSFIDLVEVIQSSDTNIRYFDATENIVEWSKICDLSKFDCTSFAKYNGLHDKFTIEKKFLNFKIKNSDVFPAVLRNLTIERNPGVDQSLPDESSEWIKVPGRSYSTISVNNRKELEALCQDLRLNSSLSYTR